jgi:hypothetical protein
VRPTKCKERRNKLIEWHHNKCHDCRREYPPHVYEFHHRNPSEKLFTLGGHNLNRKWEAVVIEASKTDMLCANCHKERHG